MLRRVIVSIAIVAALAVPASPAAAECLPGPVQDVIDSTWYRATGQKWQDC